MKPAKVWPPSCFQGLTAEMLVVIFLKCWIGDPKGWLAT